MCLGVRGKKGMLQLSGQLHDKNKWRPSALVCRKSLKQSWQRKVCVMPQKLHQFDCTWGSWIFLGSASVFFAKVFHHLGTDCRVFLKRDTKVLGFAHVTWGYNESGCDIGSAHLVTAISSSSLSRQPFVAGTVRCRSNSCNDGKFCLY